MRTVQHSAATWDQPYPYVKKADDLWPGRWEAYIPPTKPEHFQGGDVENGDVLGPWGESYWPTWEAACAFMQQCSQEIREAVFG
jgi:hypothetical protein